MGVLRQATPFPSSKDHRAWRVIMQLHKLDGNPLPDDILTMAKEGGIGVSIGFEPTDFGPPTDDESKAYTRKGKTPRSVVRSWRWLELSVTALPCNVSCRSDAMHEDDSKMGMLDNMLTKGLIQRETAAAFGLAVGDAKPQVRKIIVVG